MKALILFLLLTPSLSAFAQATETTVTAAVPEANAPTLENRQHTDEQNSDAKTNYTIFNHSNEGRIGSRH